MNYQETLDFLYSQLPMFQRQGAAAYKANLNNTLALCKMLGNPENDFPSIHIAGTNGKGSTANMIASVFQQAGFKTGLYTSPHLVDFRERIRINGEMIPQQNVIDFVAKYSKEFIKIQPSFFEITFAMAIDYFRHEKVDMVIMETGMGGRLDSTNVVKSILSIITNIGLDHTAFLGDTLEKIAGEKAGIIKPGVPVIIGEKQEEIAHVFENKSENSDLIWAEEKLELMPISTESGMQYQVKQGGEEWARINFPMQGVYQQKNLRTALSALFLLQDDCQLSKEDMVAGLENVNKNTGFAGRWQVVQQNPSIIMDTGHNVEGLSLTMAQLKTQKYNQLHFVLGMVNDKDVSTVMELLPKEAKYYFCKADIPRGMEVERLQSEAESMGLKGEAYASVKEAFNQAKQNAKGDDLVFVGGSTFTVAEALEEWGGEN